jgi:glycosyltransferase domain-containing protein
LTSSRPLARKFTLIIPTYNRSAELSRLLGYLSRHRADFPVLVLDSSEPAIKQANKAAVEKLDCDIRLKEFDPRISPWEKFWRGSELVETQCCSLCADDDLVMPGSLDPLVGFLEEHPDHSVAHGWYFTFYDNVHVGITASVYRGASIDHGDPLVRLFAMFKNYEAVTYGVYRTDVMRSVLSDVQGVESMLGRELLGGALSIVRGKAARLPIFYYGRSHAPSYPYMHWHPLEFLVSSPEGLYRDYAAYRTILLACFKSTGYDKYTQGELATVIDLIHFRYLADYAKPRVMDYLTEQMMARTPKPEIVQGLWSALARENEHSLAGALSGRRLLRRIRDRFFPWIRLHHFRRYSSAQTEHRTVRSRTAGGRQRDYLFHKEFLASLSNHRALEKEINTIVAALDCYE